MRGYQDFVKESVFSLGEIIPKDRCNKLREDVLKAHKFSPEMFVSEAEYKTNPPKTGCNPGPGFNLAEKIDIKFIEQNKTLVEAMTRVLGKNYRLELVKFIMGIPQSWVPEWVNATGTHNLNVFSRREYWDISYFYGAHWHQDVVDFSGPKALKSKTFVVLYVYLDQVETSNAPIYVLPGSHKFGATTFPHYIDILPDSSAMYRDDHGHSGQFECRVITGGPGAVNFWHSLTLHRTSKISDIRPRVSLKYVFEKTSKEPSLIDELDATCQGPLVLEKHRRDMTATQLQSYFARSTK